jgi:anti-sigma-K factor RskA
MQETEHAHILELIPAYALGSLDAEELEQVADHLGRCEACQEELIAYQEVADSLSLAAPGVAPPAELKRRLMAQVVGEGVSPASVAALSQAPPAQARRWWGSQTGAAIQKLFSGPRWQPLALLLIVALGISNILLWQRVNEADHELGRELELTSTEAAPSATGIIYISRNGRYGALIVEDLPPLAPEEQYQLWLIRDGQRDSGAVFSVSKNGYRSLQIDAPQPLGDYSAFGITIEPAGGSPGPTGQRVLGFNL